MEETPHYRCPVCNALFRETSECSRCGADLQPLFRLLVAAYRRREKARTAIRDQDFDMAHAIASHARTLHDVKNARRLEILAGWLVETQEGNTRINDRKSQGRT